VAEEPVEGVLMRTLSDERPKKKKDEKSSDEIVREIGFINGRRKKISRPSQDSNRVGRKIRNPKSDATRLNSLVQRGIMRLARRYRITRSSTEEVDAEMV
jgi:hypothetical protein